MSKSPVVYRSTHRVRFSEMDPYHHMNTGVYASYYADHRMECLRRHLGWDVKTLATLPFMFWVRRLEVDYVRPVVADQELVITSFVREVRGSDAFVDCTMADAGGQVLSRCLMTVAHVDRATQRACDWPAERIALFFENGTGDAG